MRKRLVPSFDETNNVVIVTVTWISMMNVKSLQKAHVKLGVMPDLRPFLSWHDSFKIRGSNKVSLLEVDQSVCFSPYVVPQSNSSCLTGYCPVQAGFSEFLLLLAASRSQRFMTRLAGERWPVG